MKSFSFFPSAFGSSPFVLATVAALVLAFDFDSPAQTIAPAAYYANPVIKGDYPDPSIVRLGQNYIATATSSEWAPIFPILYSRDLVNWDVVGSVFTIRPLWAVANFWAPEISIRGDLCCVYYVARKKGGPLSVALATSHNPFGPYEDHGPLVSQEDGSIDPMAVRDDSGQYYLIWKEDGNSRRRPTPIWAQKLSADGTGLVGEMKELIRNDAPWEGGVVEGPFILKHNGFFYLFYSGNGCCGSKCSYAMGVARSKSLLGPYEKNPMNPILAENNAWKCPGHGSIVTDPRGRTFLLYHSYQAEGSIYVGRQGMLDEVTWGADGWPAINGGKGPSTRHLAPFSLPQLAPSPLFSDHFSGATLNPAWQWPIDQQPRYRLLSKPLPGLSLEPQLGSGDNLSGVLALSARDSDYTVGVELDRNELGPGSIAGVAAYGDARNAIYVACTRQEATLYRRRDGKDEKIASAALTPGPALYLKMNATKGRNFTFSLSEDNRPWRVLGKNTNMESTLLPPWDRGIRFALIAGGEGHSTYRSIIMEKGSAPPAH